MKNLLFNIEKFVYTKREDALDLSFIPSNRRRRLSLYDRHILYSVNSCMDSETENIVLSSQFGETKRLLDLIAQHEELNESSPMMFSASVHNYPVGQMTMLKQKTIPTLALSAGNLSFINGLVTAVTSPYNDTIYCYADNMNNEIISLCFKISSGGRGKYVLRRAENYCTAELEEIVSFFGDNGNLRVNFLDLNGFSIERCVK